MVLADPSPFPPVAGSAALLASYLLGAVPFGLVLARTVKGVDLRQVGSGNIGATNTMRAMGRGWGLFAFALDFLKGWAPVFLIGPLAVEEGADPTPLAVACGAAAVLGHCFPVYLKFRGGKGVATGCGAIVALDPWIFLLGGLVWLATLATSRFVGLSSILMGLAFPVVAWVRHGTSRPAVWIGASLLTLLILIRHRSNMARMMAGTEPRIGQKKPAAGTPSK